MHHISSPLRLSIVGALLLIALIIAQVVRDAPALQGAGAATPAAYLPLVARPGPTSTPPPTITVTRTATPTAMSTPTTTPQQACIAVYPIAIGAELLDQNGFVPPTDPAELPYYVSYSDATYTNKTQRRLYVTPSGPLAGYGFLSWTSTIFLGNGGLTKALSGTGTLAQGFSEVTPWPDPISSSPTGYPLMPGQLSSGDWIRVSTERSNNSDIFAALTAHVSQKTVMSLPIVDRYVGSGQNASVQFARLGDFLLRGFVLGGARPYMDLVYIGPSNLQLPLCS